MKYISPSIILGNVLDVLPRFRENTFDACFCDPPYLLEFMGKDFDKQHKLKSGSNDGERMYAWHLDLDTGGLSSPEAWRVYNGIRRD